MIEYKLMKENGAYVRKMLKKGRYDDASLTGWGRLDEVVAVMASFKYSVEHTHPQELEEAFRKHRRQVWKHKSLRTGTYIMDVTKMVVYGDYEGAGVMTTTEEILQKNGTKKLKKKKQKGFKLVTLNRLVEGQVVAEAAKLLPINEHEITVSDELLVTEYKGKTVEEKYQWGFITTLPVETTEQALEAFDCYDDRSLVENKQYRELKQGYFLKAFSGKTASSVSYHIHFSLMMMNVISLYKITNMDRHEGLLNKGIRLIRRQYLGPRIQIIVYVDSCYSVLDFLKFMNLLGRPPTGKLDDVRMRFLPW